MYRINNILSLLIIVALLIPVVSNARDVIRDDKLKLLEQKFLVFKKEKDCQKMKSTVYKIRREFPNSELYPFWAYETIKCYGSDTGLMGMFIRDYFVQQVSRIIGTKECARAIKYINKIDKKYKSYLDYSEMELQTAQCFEATDKPRSIKLYKEIDQKYSGKETSIIAQQRLKKLLLKHTWFYKRSDQIINQVRAAIVETDVERLLSVASKSDFSIGFEEESHDLVRTKKKTKMLLTSAFKNNKPILGDISTKGEKIKFLLVVFSNEDYPNWYFEFKKEDEGWHWTGIIISNIQNSRTVKDFDELGLTPRIRERVKE